MNAETLVIVDWAVRVSLIAFLCLFATFFVYSWFRSRRKKRALARYFEDELARRFADPEGGPEQAPIETAPVYAPKSNRWRSAIRSLTLAAMLTVLFFVGICFVPFPFLHNFATERAWRMEPLRLTGLTFERFFEGFFVEGEVWNQTEEPIDGLQALITIWDHNRDTLEKKLVKVLPEPLQAGKAGRFELRYEENSPFLAGYKVEFLDANGDLVPHIEGFDVR